MDKEDIAEIIYAAQQAEFGVVVETNDPERLRQRIYQMLRKLGLSLRLEAYHNEVWVVRKEA